MFLNKGFTLLEVLVAAAILASALLGLLAWQVRSLQLVSGAYWRSLAVAEGQNMLECLRANKGGAGRGRAVSRWRSGMGEAFPEALGDYSCSGARCVVTIRWSIYGAQTVSVSGAF